MKYSKPIERKLFFVSISVLITFGLCWLSWKIKASRDHRKSEIMSQQENIPNSKDRDQFPKGTGTNYSIPSRQVGIVSKPPEVDEGVSGDERNETQTIKVKLVHLTKTPFVTRGELPPPDVKRWNDAHKLYLIESIVWFDLYDETGKQIFRFPRYLNVDVAGKATAIDSSGGDIQWEWADGMSVIGVQRIVHRKPDVPLQGAEREFAEELPDSTRIYLYNIGNLNSVYELLPPKVPEGMVVRIEGISKEGWVSLASVSPKAYNHADILKNDPVHYKYIGAFSYKLE